MAAWVVNVLFEETDVEQVMDALDPLAESYAGSADVAGSLHQSWRFPTKETAYAFAYAAAEVCQQATIIEPEEAD